jgi:polysaccharide pyruvyl transferase CsaB
MKRAICCGYYGQGNGGDEALLATLLQMLPPTVEPIVLSANPQQTQQQYNVEVCDRKDGYSVLQLFRQADLFIWGGGSLIQDVTSAMSPFYYGGLMGLAQQMGLKTIAWAQGIGPLQRQITHWLAQHCFTHCSAVSVRDAHSAHLLSQWDVNFTLAPDPVWALESSSVPGLWNLPAPRIACVLRSHRLLTPKRLDILKKALISLQTATRAFILLLPFQASQDLAIAQSLHQAIPNHSKILTLSDPRQLKGVFQGVEMTIGMRLHSLIMAAAAECRCFGLSYDPKVTRLMEELELPGWELSQLPEDPNIISKAWLECYANGDALSLDRIDFLTNRAKIHQEVIQSIC